MFGYVKPVAAELRVREYDFYRAVYCGVCHAMQKHTGRLSACTLTYDSVFYALVRLCLTGDACTAKKCRCVAHPCRGRQCVTENPALRDTARAYAVLAYGKALDECSDHRGPARLPFLFARHVLRRAAKRARLPALQKRMEEELSALAALEAAHCPSADEVAACTGRMLGAFFAEGLSGDAQEHAYAVGFHLGRFIAVADACDDYEKDCRRDEYNPFRYTGEPFDTAARARVSTALTMELYALEEAMNALPLDTYPAAGNILRNILYLGLPARIDAMRPNEDPRKEKQNERSV